MSKKLAWRSLSAEHVEIGRDAGFMQVCHGQGPRRCARVQARATGSSTTPPKPQSTSPRHALRGKGPPAGPSPPSALSSRGALLPGPDMGFRLPSLSSRLSPGTTPRQRRSPCCRTNWPFTQEKNWGYRLAPGP